MVGGGGSGAVMRVIGKRLRRLQRKRRRRGETKTKTNHLNISDLPEVDIGARRERCVLLLAHEEHLRDPKDMKLMAWYPAKGELGLVSSTLMPHTYIPVDSCGGFICAVHDICVQEEFDYDCRLRVAVFNPGTKYQAELPPLDMSRLPFAGDAEFTNGLLRVTMTPPPPLHGGQIFCVHVTTSSRGFEEHQVHSFNTRRWRWESSTSFSGEAVSAGSRLVGELVFRQGARNLSSYDISTGKWMSIAAPGVDKSWDADFPAPDKFLERSRFRKEPGSDSSERFGYCSMYPFRYGDKIMGAGTTRLHELVLMELREGWKWEVVTTLCAADFSDLLAAPTFESMYCPRWPLVGGGLMTGFGWPVPAAFDLRHQIWMQLPAPLADCTNVATQTACVYEP